MPQIAVQMLSRVTQWIRFRSSHWDVCMEKNAFSHKASSKWQNVMKTALYLIIALQISNAIKLHTAEHTVL